MVTMTFALGNTLTVVKRAGIRAEGLHEVGIGKEDQGTVTKSDLKLRSAKVELGEKKPLTFRIPFTCWATHYWKVAEKDASVSETRGKD